MEKIDKWMMLAIGLVGGWVISTAPGWMHASGHEHWWGIATAFGTVGATMAAVYGYFRNGLKEKALMRADGALAVVSEAKEIRMTLRFVNRIRREIDGADSDLRRHMLDTVNQQYSYLDGLLNPRFAGYSREFVRAVLDARTVMGELSWQLDMTLLEDAPQDVDDYLMLAVSVKREAKNASSHLMKASRIAFRAKSDMQSWWA